jgi:hypothetical protein
MYELQIGELAEDIRKYLGRHAPGGEVSVSLTHAWKLKVTLKRNHKEASVLIRTAWRLNELTLDNYTDTVALLQQICKKTVPPKRKKVFERKPVVRIIRSLV